MNKKEKKKTNIILYALLMFLIFNIITNGIIWGVGGPLLINTILKYPQGNMVISEAILAVMVLVVMLLFKNSYVFTEKKESLKTGLFYGLFYLLGSVMSFLLSGVLQSGINSGFTLINLSFGCLLIGICEEFLCRGWLLNEFLERYGDTKKGIWLSIIISGTFFGLMHIGNIFTGQAIIQVIGASATGILFGLIYYKTKNIWSVIILHGLWDFSTFIGKTIPIAQSVETISSFSVFGILFTILLFFAELLNIIPYIKDIDAKPKKGSVIAFALITIAIYLPLTIITSVSSTKTGETYKYGSISLEHYAVTSDNYEEYMINHKHISTNRQIDENGKTIENIIDNNYSFKLSTNDENNLLLTNTNTNAYIEIECEKLYDYIIYEINDNYILAYIDYTNSSNAFLNYVYIKKSELSNDTQYLNTIKSNIKKYLLPDQAELLIVSDYDSNKSYLSAYNRDYGYFLLVNENEMSVLNRD